MLTIKIIENNGIEQVKEVEKVMWLPVSRSGINHPCVTYYIDRTAYDVFEGLVYVMNDNGKTVANYALGEHIQEK